MNFKEIIKKRYAVKKFNPDKKISEEDLNEILEMIRLAPSSYNLQPWKIIVITKKDLKEKLVPASYGQTQVRDCSHLLVFCADKNISTNIGLLEKEMISQGAKPEEIKGYIDMMKNSLESLSEEEQISWAQKQVYIALSHAMNGAKSLQIDSCPMEGFNPAEYSKILEIAENLVPSVVCPIGYASDSPKPKLRFSKEKIFEFRN